MYSFESAFSFMSKESPLDENTDTPMLIHNSQTQARAQNASFPKPKSKLRLRGHAKSSGNTSLMKLDKTSPQNDIHEVEDDSTRELWVSRRANARLHRPMSDEEELSKQLAFSFENLDLQRAWFAYVPSRVSRLIEKFLVQCVSFPRDID